MLTKQFDSLDGLQRLPIGVGAVTKKILCSFCSIETSDEIQVVATPKGGDL